MKKSRVREGGNPDKSNDIEYFLKMRDEKENLIYVGWYIPSELLLLEECVVKRPALMGRLNSPNKFFDTVEKCITTSKFKGLSCKNRSGKIKAKILAKQKNEAYLIKDLTYVLSLLWPAGSMYKKARILNSK